MQDGQRAAVRGRNPFACGSDAWLVFPRGGSDARGVLRRAVATAVTKCRRHGHFLPRHRVRALTEWWQDCVCQLSVFFLVERLETCYVRGSVGQIGRKALR